MNKNKTAETGNSVREYIESIPEEKKRNDCTTLVELFKTVSGFEPKMWGPGIVGFGSYHYRYDSGHEGDAPLVGLAARKAAITLYLLPDFTGKSSLLEKLGKHKIGKGCIYLNKLEDIDTMVLTTMIRNSIDAIKKLYP